MPLETKQMEIFSSTCRYRLLRHLPFAAYLISAASNGIISMPKSLSDIDRGKWKKKKQTTKKKHGMSFIFPLRPFEEAWETWADVERRGCSGDLRVTERCLF